MIRFKFGAAFFVVAALAVWWTSDATAACTGSNPTWTSTPDRTSVAQCVSNAANGATINVTAGSSTWSSDIDITKSITLAGAGIGTTIITGRANILDVGTGASVRITGFTFNLGSGNYMSVWSTQGFRVDHNRFTRTNHDFMILVGGNPNFPTEGLFDNNQIVNGSIVHFGQSGDNAGRLQWSQPLNLGTAQAVYIEDNVFQFDVISGSFPGSIDGNWGSRTVFRFNQNINGRVEQHSLQGDNARAVRLWEIYNNTFTSAGNYRPFFIRGGTGMIFHNTSDGAFSVNEINIDNARSSEGSIQGQVPTFGMCDGSSFVDGNTSGSQGWPCRDQIGRSTDASLWNYSNPAPSQVSAPAYMWRNTQPSGEIPVDRSCEAQDARCTRQNTLHLIESRDYYTYRSSFNGTAGVGEGPLANRPTTCTQGVGYWATDQGNWNKNPSGQQGILYRCSATNTWSVHYTPYTYPHPLQGSAGSTPAAPTGLIVQ